MQKMPFNGDRHIMENIYSFKLKRINLIDSLFHSFKHAYDTPFLFIEI